MRKKAPKPLAPTAPTPTAVAAPARLPLSQERVLRCALALADSEGLAALSMRRVAKELGVEAMSLYNHLADKEQLLDGIVELVSAEIELASTELSWRDSMARRAHSARAVFLRHPWAPALSESRRSGGPVRLAACDAVLRVLASAGFSPRLAQYAFLTLDSYIYGFTLQETNWPFKPEERKQAIEDFSQGLQADQYPHIAAMAGFAIQARELGRGGYDTEFKFGLELILDGLERARAGGAYDG